jgi:hypothetical protein
VEQEIYTALGKSQSGIKDTDVIECLLKLFSVAWHHYIDPNQPVVGTGEGEGSYQSE